MWVGGPPPPGKNPCTHCIGGWGGPQDWFGQVFSRETLMPPLGFKPQTIKPIVSCYAEYAVLAPEKRGVYS